MMIANNVSKADRNTDFDRMPPHDIRAEQSLVSSLYLAAIDRPDWYAEILEIVGPDDFFISDHGVMFRAVMDLVARSVPVDTVTFVDELKRIGKYEEIGGGAYIGECLKTMPSAAHGVYYAKIVREHSRLRRIIAIAHETIRRAYEPSTDEELSLSLSQAMQAKASDLAADSNAESVDFAQAVEITIQELENGGVPCVPTGFRDIDDSFRGLGIGETVVIAARPSMGKSLLSRQIAVQIARMGNPVGIVAAEESKQKIVRNVLAWYSGFPNDRIRKGRENGHFNQSEWNRLLQKADELKRLPIHVADQTWALDRICSLGTTWKSKQNIKAMIVDHIGLVRVPGLSVYERASTVSTTLKQLYKRLDVAGISVVQLNRGNTARDDKRPTMADLRDSGRIEEDADGIMLLHREDYYHRTDPQYVPTSVAEVIVGKWRDGDTSHIIRLQSRLTTQHFEDMPEDHPF